MVQSYDNVRMHTVHILVVTPAQAWNKARLDSAYDIPWQGNYHDCSIASWTNYVLMSTLMSQQKTLKVVLV